jgi:hypothetical protein
LLKLNNQEENMKKLLLTAIVVTGLLGCTKEEVKEKACDTAKMASTIVAAQVSAELACKNLAAVKQTIEDKLVEIKVCEAVVPAQNGAMGAKSLLGEALCAPVIEGIFKGGISQLPKEWECSGGKLADEAKAKLVSACAKAF